MARVLDFTKVRETEREVEYSFGHPKQDRSLVIDKQTETSRPLDGLEDTEYGGVVFKILRTRQAEMEWPEKGMLAT